jgi:quinol monooxygenase YgiN
MANNFTVIIEFEAKPEHSRTLSTVLEELIDPSRGETGCIRYDSFADTSDPTRFTIIEEWEREQQWLAHLETPHGKKALAMLPDILAKPFTAQKLSPLPRRSS